MPRLTDRADSAQTSSRPSAAQARVQELETSGDFPVYRPSEVLPQGSLGVPVAVDTETNHLFGDDGSRVSTASVAWIPDEIVRDSGALLAAIRTGQGVVEYAFPFDQGVRDKPLTGSHQRRYRGGQLDLFNPQDVNLPASEWAHLLAWLSEQDSLDMHNAKFDLEKLRLGTRHWTGLELLDKVGHDSQLTCKEMWPLESTSLKPTGDRLWGHDSSAEARALKPWLGPKTDPRYDLVPWNIIGPYAAKDGHLTTRLSWWQRILLEEGEGDRGAVAEALEYMRVLYLMEERGMPFDAGLSLAGAELIQVELDQLAAKLPFEPSTNNARDFYFGPPPKGLGMVPFEATATGIPVMNKDVARRLEKVGAPHIETYARWRKLETANTMWYRGWAEKVGPDGRIRTCFRQTMVKSGRLSVERFQAQAIPHDDKLAELPPGVARPAQIFPFPNGWTIDLAQAELRVACEAAKCSSMRELIYAGEDLHGVTARQLFEVTPASPDWFTKRQVAKRGNFSLIFGVGWKTFMNDLREQTGIEITEAQSKRIVTEWNALYPEYRKAIDAWSHHAMQHKWVPLANGKKHWFSDFDLQYGCHQAFNQYVQPSLAELAKDWTIDTERRHPGHLVMTVHDSQYLDLPQAWDEARSRELAQDVARRAAELGTEMFGIKMDADVSRWGEH